MPVAGVRDTRTYGRGEERTGDAVYCGRANPAYGLRASKWENPYRVGAVRGGLPEVLEAYERRVRRSPELWGALRELDGKILLCWCTTWTGSRPYPERRCHCDVLADLLVERERA
jgi:hypothetical protein